MRAPPWRFGSVRAAPPPSLLVKASARPFSRDVPRAPPPASLLGAPPPPFVLARDVLRAPPPPSFRALPPSFLTTHSPPEARDASGSTDADEGDAGLIETRVWGPSQAIEPWLSFRMCSFPTEMMRGIEKLGLNTPMPLQSYCWPILSQGKDLIGISGPGSGKILGYLLPAFARCLGKRIVDHSGEQVPQARSQAKLLPFQIVAAHSREQVVQIQSQAEHYGRRIGIQAVGFYAGGSTGPQLGNLLPGRCVAVGTPDSLVKLRKDGTLRLDEVSDLVLDEVDQMFERGFEAQVRALLSAAPSSRIAAMFSALWPPKVRRVAAEYLKSPFYVQTEEEPSAEIFLQEFLGTPAGALWEEAAAAAIAAATAAGEKVKLRAAELEEQTRRVRAATERERRKKEQPRQGPCRSFWKLRPRRRQNASLRPLRRKNARQRTRSRRRRRRSAMRVAIEETQ